MCVESLIFNMKYIIVLSIVSSLSLHVNAELDENVEQLTDNFFANLDANLDGSNTTKTSYEFINTQINNYINLIKQTYTQKENASSRHKRNLGIGTLNQINKHQHDYYYFRDLIPKNIINTHFPKDIMLFKHYRNGSEKYYAVVIEKGKEDSLVVLKYNGKNFEEKIRKSVNNGIKLGLHTSVDGTYMIVAENNKTKSGVQNKTALYLFTLEEELYKVQNLYIDFISDVGIWENNDEMFMVITKQMTNNSGIMEYDVQSGIYKWLGSHFDLLQSINTSEAMKVTPFKIGKSQFIAFANRQNNNGDTNIYSEIYKYDFNLSKFKIYQKLKTNGAIDIQFICFTNKNRKEYYLVIANSYPDDMKNDNHYKTNSIIYKFVDNYFIPFQNVPINFVVQWQPVVGPNGEFALIAASKNEGVKVFQYNGWKFVETPISYTNEALGKGIIGLNSYIFKNTSVIVVANENDSGDQTNLFEVHFEEKNDISSYYDSMLTWCRKSIENMKSNGRVVRQATPIQEDVVQDIQEEISEIKSKVNSHKIQIEEIGNIIEQTSNQSRIYIFPNDIFAEHLIFNNDNFFNSVISKNINDIDVFQYVQNIIAINREMNLANLELNQALFKGNVTLRNVNKQNSSSMLYVNKNLKIKDVQVKGNIIFNKELVAGGKINNIRISGDYLLLSKGNQTLKGELIAKDLKASNLRTNTLNKLTLENLQTPALETIRIDQIFNINISELTVGGYINNIDLPTLNKYALRTNGAQTFTKNVLFDTLHTENIEVKNMNGKIIPDSLILINQGQYRVNQDVQFVENINCNKLNILNKLNEIQVTKHGKLDVLLTNVSDLQYIEGSKRFFNIHLLKPFDLRGNFKSKNLNTMNPVTTIDKELLLPGDYEIKGNISVEKLLSARNAKTSHDLSLENLMKNGLKITEEKIPIHLNFKQQLNVDNIIIDKLNNIKTSSLVVNGFNETQYISGPKLILGDLHITDKTYLHNFNDINLVEFEESILKIEGNQTITGKHSNQEITTESLEIASLKLGDEVWDNLVQISKSQKLMGTTKVKSVNAQNMECSDINITEHINGINFDNMLNDTVYMNSTQKIYGYKHFLNLNIEHLETRRSINMNKIPSMIKRLEAVFNDKYTMMLPSNLTVEKIYFLNKLNDITAEDFSSNWLGYSENETIVGDQYFENLELQGTTFVDSNTVNGYNLSEIAENSVKIDEPHDFENVIFNVDLISLDTVILNGHIEGVDIENIVADSGKQLLISDDVHFFENVSINGKLYVEGLLNSFNISSICNFAESTLDGLDKLVIRGDALFMKGPLLNEINDRSIKNLMATSWFTKEETNLTGHMHFKNLYFNEDITVDGYIDEVSLEWLLDNYFSKTKNQTISSRLDFASGIYCKSDLKADLSNVKTVSGINLNDFVEIVLLNGTNQILEEVFFVENCTVNDLQGQFLVNKMDIQNDVMRYDSENMVTGIKTFRDINVETLKMERKINVQGVNLMDWFETGILKSSNSNIKGRTMFLNSTIFKNGISLEGLLNRNKFTMDKVLLKSVIQDVVAFKSFANTENPTFFQTVKLVGSLNNIILADLIKQQVFKNENTTFSSKINFNTNITAKSVIFSQVYNNVNVSDLLFNLTNYVKLNNYYNNYASLLDISKKVQNSLNFQAHYLTHFETIQKLDPADLVLPIKYFHGNTNLVILRSVNNSQTLEFLKWEPQLNLFSIDYDGSEIVRGNDLTNIIPIEYNFKSYLYFEHRRQNHITGNSKIGNIVTCAMDENAFIVVGTIASNGTKAIVPFTFLHNSRDCLLMLYNLDENIHIYCYNHDNWLLYQTLYTTKAIQASTMYINGSVYLIALTQDVNHREGLVIWKNNGENEVFTECQYIHTINPKSISTISYNNEHYVIVASGNLTDSFYQGQLLIKRFNKHTQQFTKWQELSVNSPKQVTSVILPSNELFLYLLCDNPTQLVVYKYNGLAKFLETTTIPLVSSNFFKQFTDGLNHFITVKDHVNNYKILQAVFKGHRYV